MTPKERISAVVAEWTRSGGYFAGHAGSQLQERLEEAVEAAIAEEREACAKVAARMSSDSPTYEAHLWAADIAAAIRARGSK